MSVIQNPVKVCDQVFALIENLTHQIRERMQDPSSVGWYEYYQLPSKVLGVDTFLTHSGSLWFYTRVVGVFCWKSNPAFFFTVCLLRPAALPQ